MTKTCCVPSCKIRSDDPKGFDLTFHKVPADKSLYEKWQEIFTKKFNLQLKNWSHVCSLDFNTDCFYYTGLCKNVRLKKGSCPSIFLDEKQIDVQHVALENFSLAFENQNVCNNENTNVLLQNNITNNQLDLLMSQSVEANSIELVPQAVENCNELMLSQSEYVDYDKLILQFEEGSIDRVLKQNILCESTESEKATTSLLTIDIEKLNLTKIEKEALNKAKTEIINVRRKNKSLQMKLYRWKKRVKNADSLLYHMKSRKLLNEKVRFIY